MTQLRRSPIKNRDIRVIRGQFRLEDGVFTPPVPMVRLRPVAPKYGATSRSGAAVDSDRGCDARFSDEISRRQSNGAESTTANISFAGRAEDEDHRVHEAELWRSSLGRGFSRARVG